MYRYNEQHFCRFSSEFLQSFVSTNTREPCLFNSLPCFDSLQKRISLEIKDWLNGRERGEGSRKNKKGHLGKIPRNMLPWFLISHVWCRRVLSLYGGLPRKHYSTVISGKMHKDIKVFLLAWLRLSLLWGAYQGFTDNMHWLATHSRYLAIQNLNKHHNYFIWGNFYYFNSNFFRFKYLLLLLRQAPPWS